ncbi:hypothetical protein SCHPADRAFT_946867 [Schizopora paradoxa]|uniref:DUF6830 domain-containing protein n=1 Tax=Schizopora paradoxa TaxID=27342 RepID=A0A0H2RL05_9AGAM|nr:hypothetical protein SCHPADRAFT_946867 [Schizopora paradoxa]
MICDAPNCGFQFRYSKSLNLHLRHSESCQAHYRNYLDFSSDSEAPDSEDESTESDSDDEGFNSALSSGDDKEEPGMRRTSGGVDLEDERPLADRLRAVLKAIQAKRARSPPSTDTQDSSPGATDNAGLDNSTGVPTPQNSGGRKIDEYDGAGEDFGEGNTILDEISLAYFVEQRRTNRYFPFKNKDDWEVAAWISTSGLSMAETDRFLKLQFVASSDKLSYKSAKQLHAIIAKLPKPPAWKAREIIVEGGSTRKPIIFLYRDGLELFKYLFGNPILQGRMQLAPFREWADAMRDLQVFGDPMSSNLPWEIQSHEDVAEGETLGLVMLGSDVTHLNNTYGDKKTHAVYLSCGNIDKELRSKISAKCWMMLAQIPIVKFLETEFQGILTERLYHICMKIATETLQKCAEHPVMMADPEGIMRLVRTILLAHLTDNPEQTTIACVSSSISPVTIAVQNQFGSGRVLPVRTKAVTLSRIRELLRRPGLRTSVLKAYKLAALNVGLNGVFEPYWADWKFACPSNFITPDALHQWHKFFEDHLLIFIAVLYGSKKVNPSILKAFSGIMQFIYYAQLEEQTEETLSAMDAALMDFHANKKALSATGLRRGKRMKGQFNINKLETMLSVVRQLRQVGSSGQFSTEQVEILHIPMAKKPYKFTNRKEFAEQMCRYLDRREKVELFREFLEWESIEPTIEVERDGVRTMKRDVSSLQSKLLPPLVKDWFQSPADFHPRNDTTVFLVADRIFRGDMKVRDVGILYRLPRLRELLDSFHRNHYTRNHHIRRQPFELLDCWDRVRLQTRPATRRTYNLVLPPSTLMASPPTKDAKFGHCNFALVKARPYYDAPQLKGFFVAQVRLIFQPVHKEHPASHFLAYVEPFVPSTTREGGDGDQYILDPDIKMFRIRRDVDIQGHRKGLIINLTDVWRQVAVVPCFGARCPKNWDTHTALEYAQEFILNSHDDKEMFTALHVNLRL